MCYSGTAAAPGTHSGRPPRPSRTLRRSLRAAPQLCTATASTRHRRHRRSARHMPNLDFRAKGDPTPFVATWPPCRRPTRHRQAPTRTPPRTAHLDAALSISRNHTGSTPHFEQSKTQRSPFVAEWPPRPRPTRHRQAPTRTPPRTAHLDAALSISRNHTGSTPHFRAKRDRAFAVRGPRAARPRAPGRQSPVALAQSRAIRGPRTPSAAGAGKTNTAHCGRSVIPPPRRRATEP